MTKVIELCPNKSFINSFFEKYQFSSNVVPIISEINLKKSVYRLEPNQNQESWLETRLFAFHNHLFQNPYDMSYWFIDKNFEVWRLDKNDSLDQVHILHTIETDLSKIIYNPSIGFTTNEILAICNGGEKLDVLIGIPGQNIKIFSLDLIKPGVIMNVQYIQKTSKIIVAMCTIAENCEKKYTQLILLSYILQYVGSEIRNVFYIGEQILKVRGTVDYVYIEKNGNFLHSICQDIIGFENENINRFEDEMELSNIDSQIKNLKYFWSQDEDSLTVLIKIPQQYKNKLPKINIKALDIYIAIDNEVLIQGESLHRLEENMTTWRYKNGTLEIDLSKCESGLMWNELIKGDTEGEYLPNKVLAAEIHERLAHLCTEQNNVHEDQLCMGFNTEQLEECDLEGKDNFLQRINLSTHATTHLARLDSNNHVLFTYKRKHGQTICLRHDHNACIWVIDDMEDDTQWNIRHIHSFPGLGYVEASKTNKKFCVSPTDGSYVAIVEHTRHIFLYEKPDIMENIAKQRIVDLSYESSPIMGVIATNKYLILLSKDKLYRLRICTG